MVVLWSFTVRTGLAIFSMTTFFQNQGMVSSSRLFMHHAIALGATVPDNVRRLIWADEFVELSRLLPETMDKALKPKNVDRNYRLTC
jgi:hypothetical protein